MKHTIVFSSVDLLDAVRVNNYQRLQKDKVKKRLWCIHVKRLLGGSHW